MEIPSFKYNYSNTNMPTSSKTHHPHSLLLVGTDVAHHVLAEGDALLGRFSPTRHRRRQNAR